jgi:hypothetical protein
MVEMSILPIVFDLKQIDIPLESIYLDPNNPRFIGPDWTFTPDVDIKNDEVQDKTILKLVSDFQVGRLKMNMEVNGYLPIDRVIVREFSKSKYVVLEGNRRICAAKLLSKDNEGEVSLPTEIVKSLERLCKVDSHEGSLFGFPLLLCPLPLTSFK